MVTIQDIKDALLDPSDKGTRAIGRALVLLYTERFGGIHQNPLGIASAQYYLNHNTLTSKHLTFWRRPLKDGTPHILLHVNELLEFAETKKQRRQQLFETRDPLVQHILDQHDELLVLAQDLIRTSEPSIYEPAIKELQAFEQRHNMTPSRLLDIEQPTNDQKEQT